LNWAAKEGMPSDMVSQVYHDVSLSHYGVDWPSYSHICCLLNAPL
jgi:hypothetical protein